jgi:hypothetical protein
MTVNELIHTNAWLSNKLRQAEEALEQADERYKALVAEYEQLLTPQPTQAPGPQEN